MNDEKYETFMVYELDDSGEKMRLDINEEQLHKIFHPKKVLLIVREDLRRIFIWKGPKSPIRKRFIGSQAVQALQEELMKNGRYHRCKIVSIDAGDEPFEFLNAFGLKSMNDDENFPFPYIFKPPKPPDDLVLAGQASLKEHITKQVLGHEPCCKHCGAELPEGQSICHACGKKVI